MAATGLPISLTSISNRLDILVKTLRNLLSRQTLKPSGIYVYLSKEPYLLDKGCTTLPMALQTLFQTEPLLHLRWVPNTGPFRKCLPFAKEFPDTPVLVLDDDTDYVPTLVETATKLWKEHGCCISFRATVYDTETPYMSWMDAKGYKAVSLFSKGNGGVVYHTSWFQNPSFYESKAFLELCPTNDDIWFNAWRIKQNIPLYCSPIQSFSGTEPTGQCLFQWNESKNDENIRKTFQYVLGF